MIYMYELKVSNYGNIIVIHFSSNTMKVYLPIGNLSFEMSL